MMADSILNAPSFDPNIMPQYATKTTNKPRYLDDDFYVKKIGELANEKLKLFVRNLEKVKDSNKKKKAPVKKVVTTAVVSNELTDRLKRFIADEMKGSDIKLVIQKSLFMSDLDKGQNRLNIPINQLNTHDFLTTDEKEFLRRHKNNEIKARVLGPRFRMYEEAMEFKIWNVGKNKNYVLKGAWSKFVNDNKDDLIVRTLIQVWSFRKDQELFFAIICLT